MKKIARLFSTLIMIVALIQGCASQQINKSNDILFKEGEESFRKGKYQDAITQWKKVKESYQSPELTTRAELGIANAYFLNRDYIESAAAYEDFRKMHPNHSEAAFALYRQGLSYFNQINRIDTDQTPVKNAVTVLESYLKLYPDGEHLGEVRNKVRECQDKQLQYEIYVGRFYLKSDAYNAAIGRFEEALKSFPDQARRDEVLYCLGRAYLENGQKEKGLEFIERLSREFPSSPFVHDSNKTRNSLL